MEYNTERPKMIIPEYGRHIHNMIWHAVAIVDKNERNRCAWSIIKVMGDLNPHLRDVPDFQHKLWDQLFIMSDFKLKVDSPFSQPEPEQFQRPPRKISYPEYLLEVRYYGKIVRDMIAVVVGCSDSDKKEGLTYAIANTMKKNYIKWNKDTVEDSVIFEDLRKLSGGKIVVNKPSEPLILGDEILQNGKKRSKNGPHNNPHRKKKFFGSNGSI